MDTITALIQGLLSFDESADRFGLSAVAVRAALLYIYGVLVVRVGKSRLMGNATALDVVVVIVLGSLLSRGINGSASLSSTVVACAVLIACHWLSTWATARSHSLENIIKGHAKVLVVDGQLDKEALRCSHLSCDDLREEMRINGNVEDVEMVHRAYKERSGKISVVRRAPEPKIVEIQVREGVQTVRIELNAGP